MIRCLLLVLSIIFSSFVGGEEGKQIALTDEQNEELNKRAAQKAIEQLFESRGVLREAIIRKDEYDRTIVENIKPPSKIQSRQLHIKLSSIDDTHDLYVYPNQITSLSFLDSLGNPYKFTNKPSVPAEKAYSVSLVNGQEGVLTIQTKAKYIPSNLVVFLENRVRPIVFQLVADGRKLDSYVEVLVKGASSTSRQSLKKLNEDQVFVKNVKIPKSNENILSTYLSGTEDSRKNAYLVVGDSSVAAWHTEQNQMIIRVPARYKMLHPTNIIAVNSGPDSLEKAYLVAEKTSNASFIDSETSLVVNILLREY